MVVDYVAPAPIEVASQDAVDALTSNIRFSAKTEQDKLEMFQLATEVGGMLEVCHAFTGGAVVQGNQNPRREPKATYPPDVQPAVFGPDFYFPTKWG